MAIAAGLWMAAPNPAAHAAETDDVGVSDHELVELRERVASRREAATRILAHRLTDAFARSTGRVQEARMNLEYWMTFGYGFNGLMTLEPSSFTPVAEVEAEPEPEVEAEPEVEVTPEPAKPRRFEYDDDTSDPLGGLF